MRKTAGLATCVLIGALLSTARAELTPPLVLDAGDRFPALGATFTLTLTGPPGTAFNLWRSSAPSQWAVADAGTVYLDAGAVKRVRSGVLSGTGEATIELTVPDNPALTDLMVYLQANASVGPDRGLSNAVTLRLEELPPNPLAARKPAAIAATPDGTRAFVVHAADASMSVLDAVNDSLLFETPLYVPETAGSLPTRVAVDPEGRHVFVVSPLRREITVIAAASGSICGPIPVPEASLDVAFDFGGPEKKIYVANERDQAVLVFVEEPEGVFTPTGALPLQGRGPSRLAVLADGRILVGHRTTAEVEVLDPTAPPGSETVARTALDGPPLDFAVSASRILVSTFTFGVGPGDGQNRVLELEPTEPYAVLGAHLVDTGTDYLAMVESSDRVALVGSGSGSVVVADASDLALPPGIVDLAPGEPVATPVGGALVPPLGGGVPEKLYVVNRFRETVGIVDLSIPARVGEIPLARSGVPRIPLTGVLSNEDEGEWFFSSVAFFNGTASNPNPVTCATCHPASFSANVSVPFQPSPLFDVGATAPYGATAAIADLATFADRAFTRHGVIGGVIENGADAFLVDFLTNATAETRSPFLEADGSLSPAAQAGRLLFEGVAECASCHPEPLFTNLATLPGGVGTGVAPANVPSLRGAWATAPYLRDGSAATLRDMLTGNLDDLHGVTSSLTETDLDDLVAYLQSL